MVGNPGILNCFPAIGRRRVAGAWEQVKVVSMVGFSIDAVQKLGDGWLKAIRLLQPLHIPDQLS